MKYCCICGVAIPDKKTRQSKWANCNSMECRKESRRRQQEEQIIRARNNKRIPSPRRLANIEKMRTELNTKEEFAKIYVIYKSVKKLAEHYKVIPNDITRLKGDLFGGISPKEVQKIGRELLEKDTEKFVKKILERKPIPVKVYKITDFQKFNEELRDKFYSDLNEQELEKKGVKFSRVEYANEIMMPFNNSFAEVEGC